MAATMLIDTEEIATRRLPNGSGGSRRLEFSGTEWLGLAGCTVLGLALRAWRLDYQSLWLDEVLTVLNSQTSLARLIVRPAVDPNIPPLYYTLMHFVLAWGRSEELLRLPSLIFGTVSIPVLYFLTRHWMGHGVALTAALLLALSPFHVWYSQEARPYALLILLALVSVWLLQRLVERPARRSLKLGVVVCVAATFWTHTIALPFLAVLTLYVLLTTSSELWRYWAVMAAAVLVLMAPAIYRLIVVPPGTSANVHYQFQPAHLAYVFWAFGTGYSLGPNLIELRTEGLRSVTSRIHLLGPVLGLFAGLLAAAALHLWRSQRVVFWTLSAWLLLPIAFAVLGGIVTSHPFNVRYAILAFPAFLLLLAIGLSRLPGSLRRVAAFTGLVLISAASLMNYYADSRYQREDTRAAVRWLNDHAGRSALVLTSAPYMAVALNHYQLRADLILQEYPIRQHDVRGTETRRKTDLGARFVTAEQVHRELGQLLRNRPGLWVFLSRTFHSDPEGHILAYLEGRMKREAEFTAAGVRVAYYRRSLEVSR